MSLVSSSPVVDDTGSVDFGDTTQGTPVMRTVRIHNVGSTNLVVQPATAPTGFSVTTNFGVNQTIMPGASFDLVVQLDAGSVGPFTGGQVSFATNDGDENPFNFFVSGEVFPSGETPVVQIVDDGDATFTLASGNWENWTFGGRGSDLKYLNAVGVANWPSGDPATAGVARWQFMSLPMGQYRVSATWPGDTNRATNAPFTIIGDTTIGASINQVNNPNDLTDQGSDWEHLGMVNVTGGTLTVELTNTGANAYVIADAIRIERMGPPSVMEAGLSAGEPGASATGATATGVTESDSTDEAPAPIALSSTSTPLVSGSTDEDDAAALADLSAYSVPLEGLASSALYELWQGA